MTIRSILRTPATTVLAAVTIFGIAAAVSSSALAQAERLSTAQKQAVTYSTKLYTRGQTYLAAGDTNRARSAYWESVKTLEGAFGANDPRLIEPLRGVVITRVHERKGMKDAADAMAQIVRIREQTPDTRPAELLGARIDLGDIYLLDGKRSEATDAYDTAWRQLAANQGDADADAYFFEPFMLRFRPPAGEVADRDRRIVLQFTVTKEGKTADVKVADDGGERELSSEARRTARKIRYRPRIAGGQMVEATGVLLKLRFPANGSPALQE